MQNIIELKKGIKLHLIKTDKFKTNLLSVFISTKLDRETITYNSVIPAILRRGNANMQTMEEISIALENMYGAAFDCGIEKTGDNHILKFYLESVNDKYIPDDNQKILENSIGVLLDIIFNPLLKDNKFKEDYLKQEKENIEKIIKSKIDNKDQYSLDRCIEEMYKGNPYGLYKYGYEEDLQNINSQNLYEHYKKLIETSKIDIFISGDIDEAEIANNIKALPIIKELEDREPDYICNTDEQIKSNIEKLCEGDSSLCADEQSSPLRENIQPKIIEESMNVTQGKLIMGLTVNSFCENFKFITSLYNALLGGTANSKLFQNVREKHSLAYTAGSNYIRQKNNIFIKAGIEINNYEKAVDIIKQQIEDMKSGDFSEEDIENAKKYISSSLKMLEEEQSSVITYLIAGELSNSKLSIKEYIENINKVSKNDIIDLAKNIEINTIYFLKD